MICVDVEKQTEPELEETRADATRICGEDDLA